MKMNGRDTFDQCGVTYGAFSRRTQTWWTKIFYCVFEITQLNAYRLHVLSQPTGSRKLTL
ncbi:unnamed protein product [Lymnaea stagnalis]|uniref:Uncharacterized protein n=1 Tax=Lymnaea stagnalis TaxID=6523 RepID=A0AAV2IPY2_LYMST